MLVANYQDYPCQCLLNSLSARNVLYNGYCLTQQIPTDRSSVIEALLDGKRELGRNRYLRYWQQDYC